MSNRGRLTLLLLLLDVAAGNAFAQEMKRPNILMLFADDWGRYASLYGQIEKTPSLNHVVKTPNIDRIGKEGVVFLNAFVSAPSCTPCRSSFLSGRHFFNCQRGAILLGAEWDGSIPSWPLLLKDSGYHIGETWKVWGPGKPNDAPFGAGKFAYEKAGSRFNNFSENVAKMMADGKSFAGARDELLAEVSGNFGTFLKARPEGAPWCYWFGPTNVHRMWEKGSGQAQWGISPDSLKGLVPPFLPDVPEVRADLADYLGEIQAFDAAVGVLLKQLEATGELENTIVIISGDHGAPGFPYGKCNLYDFGVQVALMIRWPGKPAGRVVHDLTFLPDLCPTILEAGRVALPDKLDGRSLLPLLASDQQGQIDPTRTWVIVGRERHVDTARENALPYPQRGLRTSKYLYSRIFRPDRWPLGSPYDEATATPESLETNTFAAFPDMDSSPTKAWLVANRTDPRWRKYYDFGFARRPEEELYDLASDPHQINNVAADSKYVEIRKQLATELITRLTDAGDPRVVGDGLTFEKSPYSDVVRPRK